MASLTHSYTSSPSPGLRSFDPQRDLTAVADLIELCFSETLDQDGLRYIQRMRQAAHNMGRIALRALPGGISGVPEAGYVWEEQGRLVGTLSLIPFLERSKRNFLIANVAVHPDFRRRGIGRQLTARAIDYARQHGCPSVWLQVREENEPAIDLYRSLDFIDRARRTTWVSNSQAISQTPLPGVILGPRRPEHWPQQRQWLARIYPSELTWHLPLQINAMRTGLLGAIERLIKDIYLQHWSAEREGKLEGMATWQSQSGYANLVWLAAPEQRDPLVLQALLIHARRSSPSSRPLVLDFPAHQDSPAIQGAGFRLHQTLIWMSLNLA